MENTTPPQPIPSAEYRREHPLAIHRTCCPTVFGSDHMANCQFNVVAENNRRDYSGYDAVYGPDRDFRPYDRRYPPRRPEHIPANWTFHNEAVADEFDQHVRGQLPWYDLVTQAVVQIGRHFLPHGGRMYDIGASTGNITAKLAEVLHARHVKALSIEESPQMCERWNGYGDLQLADALTYEFEEYDFAVSMLCMIFLAPSEQGELLVKLRKAIRPGGALVIVERMLPPDNPYLGIVTSRLTLQAKLAAGVPAEEIVSKELSLAGVQRPVNPALMMEERAQEWFRFGDFAGYIITKGTGRQ